ncbi:hypothetical protein EVAR_46778_1 [Eumeta japonica]|uniref:Uncharacterized protein n=1 Tax=Eumeta variegata TaxID=151549 RepID=A0A4C1XFZ0_EUMVA|nr:hypothetical protein EVAR_46778_1 [Eumeta japonica]
MPHMPPSPRLCAAAVSLLLGRIGRWSGREIARSALSLARSAQAERDNESCFFMRAAGFHGFIRHYHIKIPLSDAAAVSVISYLLALPLALLIEYPAVQLYKAIVESGSEENTVKRTSAKSKQL